MGLDFIYPEFEVVRNNARCIICHVCEQQCANQVHSYDENNKVMLADESKCVILLPHSGAQDRQERLPAP